MAKVTPVKTALHLSRKSDFTWTVAERAETGERITWAADTSLWIEFEGGVTWDATVDTLSGTASWSVDKVEVDKVPAEARYWVYIHKPDDGHGVDMLLRWGRVVRHG